MANKCAICGAEINLFQTQKLADKNCICRKTCRKKGFKTFDYVHADLYGVKAYLAQVDRGTKLWNYYFVPRIKTKDKTQKLKRFGSPVYVAEDLGLMAYIQNDYKFIIFGKTTRACVYRIADLRAYNYEERIENNSGDSKPQKKSFVRMAFINTEGMSEISVEMNNIKAFQKLQKYFDTLFGVQKTLGNASNIWKAQAAAIKSAAAGVSAAIRGDTDASEKVGGAIESLDAAIYGDRTELIRRADEALAAFNSYSDS